MRPVPQHTGDRKEMRAHVLRLLRDARKRSKKKKLTFCITEAHIIKLYMDQKGLCALSSKPLLYGKKGTGSDDVISLDRIDNVRGYEPQNIQLLTKAVNNAKATLSVAAFQTMCQDVHAAKTWKSKDKLK